MRIAVTGSTKLAGTIIKRFNADSYRVEDNIDFSKYDVFINNAHVGFSQATLLQKWFDVCRYDKSKTIINISSRAALPNLSKGYSYGAQKAALDHLADNLTYNSDKLCKIITINLGMLEDELPSVSYEEVCNLINDIINMPEHLEMSRVFFQHRANYQEIQDIKKSRYG